MRVGMKITTRRRGPICVEGEFELFDAQGRRLDLSDRPRVLLCRCGESKTTPICDGSHNRSGFFPDNEREPEETP